MKGEHWRLRIKAGKDDLEGPAATTVETVVGYLENNLEYLDYQKCLKEGSPIATGIIEGRAGIFSGTLHHVIEETRHLAHHR